MNKDNYLNDINLFYKLKNKYDERRKELKNKLLKKYNKDDVKKKMKTLSVKCINCENVGGTKFIINEKYLIAKCNCSNKCDLSIKIKKGKYIEHSVFKDDIKNHLETLKQKIIENKLKLLFNLEKEEIIVTEFDSLKSEYHEFTEKDKLLNVFINNLNKTRWSNYIEFYKEEKEEEKEEKEGETKRNSKRNSKRDSKRDTKKSKFKSENSKKEEIIKKEELIKIINKEIDDNISELKLLINEYKNNEIEDKVKLRNAIQIYIDKILPNSKKVRELKYSEFYVEETQIGGGSFGQEAIFDYKIKNKKHSYDDLEVIIEEYKTIEKILNRKKVGKLLTNNLRSKSKFLKPVKKGATLTFSSTVENHVGMAIHGEKSDGYTIQDLENAKNKIKSIFKDAEVEIFDLRNVLPENKKSEAEPASILIFKNGVNILLDTIGKNSVDLFNEHEVLEKDTKYKDRRKNKVLNKKARHNLCFADEEQEANYLEGLGTIVPFSKLPLTAHIRKALPKIIGEKAKNKKAEGNYYYNLNETGIGFHGDSERKDVIGVRFGEDQYSGFPLHYQWYLNSEPIGDRYKFDLKNGDIYVMSEKAVGSDWKKRKKLTLRHAAGADKYLKIDRVDPEINKLIGDDIVNYEETKFEEGDLEEGDLFEEMSKDSKKTSNDMERPDLYDDSSIFVFYSKSRDVMPGKGGNNHKDAAKKWSEKVSDPTKFDELGRIKDWRKVLSNMWGALSQNEDKPLFNLDGYDWASVEHWFHANKFKWRVEESDEYKDFYEKFTFNSGSEICKDAKLALTAGGRSGKVMGKKYRPKSVVLDPNWEDKKERIMINGQKAKYEQDELSKNVLLATKDAKLVHLMLRRGKGSVLVNFNDTMEIRQSMTETTGFRKIEMLKTKTDLFLDDIDDDEFNEDLTRPVEFNDIKLEFSDSDD